MFVTALLVAAGIASHAQSARPLISCTLTNGDRVSGDMLAVTGTRVRIANEVLGTLALQRSAIAVCETTDSTARARLGNLALDELPDTPISSVGVLPDNPVPAGVAVGEMISLEHLLHPTHPVPLAARALPTYVSHVGWKRSLGTTYMLSRGNANVSSLGFTGAVARRTNRTQIALSGKREFGSQDGSATENYLSATLRYDLALGPNDSAAAARPSFFSEAVFEHDPFAQIARRAVENTGVSMPLSADPHNKLALEVGTGITHEAPTGGISYTRFGGLLRLAARQLLGGAKADQTIAIFPDLSGSHGHYRVNGDFNLSAPIATAIALKLGISDRYDTRPQLDVRNNDTTIQSGIGIEF